MGGPPYTKIVQELIDGLKANGWYGNLEEAVNQALAYGIIEIKKLGIIDTDSFLDYMDFLVTTWVPSEDLEGKDVYYRLVVFYFIFDQPAIKDLQSPIEPASAKKPLSWLSSWLVGYAQAMGASLDQESSLTPASLATFYNSPKYNMNEYIVPRGGWKTFNDFFARNTKPGYRPIDALSDSTVIVSPADATFDGSWPVDASSQVNIKNVEWNILDLLKDSPFADKFEGGIFMHSFLNTFDYHRQHAPVDGKVVEARVIPGQVYLEVTVVPDPTTGKPKLQGQRRVTGKPDGSLNATVSAPDDAGYQFLQCRGLVVLETKIGYIAVLPIGMAQVSSVIVTAEVGKELRKGEEISYFQFGGSDIVVVFQAQSNVEITAKFDPENPTHYNMGNQIALAHPK
jgi:phosphatidylserine decarboxylase